MMNLPLNFEPFPAKDAHLSQEQGAGEGDGRTKGWCDVWLSSKGFALSNSVKDEHGQEEVEEGDQDES